MLALENQVFKSRIRAHVHFPNRVISGSHRSCVASNSWLEQTLNQIPFQNQIRDAAKRTAQYQIEIGFTCMEQASAFQVGNMICGEQNEIAQHHDPNLDYFVHIKGEVPSLMMHSHPSGRLGFSRADCMLAQEICMAVSKKNPKRAFTWRPIFAVLTLSRNGNIVCLWVQRKRPGHFMHFHEIAQNYDAHAWLQSPYFHVAILELGQSGFQIRHNTGIQKPM